LDSRLLANALVGGLGSALGFPGKGQRDLSKARQSVNTVSLQFLDLDLPDPSDKAKMVIAPSTRFARQTPSTDFAVLHRIWITDSVTVPSK
jgi:hypothetical protein